MQAVRPDGLCLPELPYRGTCCGPLLQQIIRRLLLKRQHTLQLGYRGFGRDGGGGGKRILPFQSPGDFGRCRRTKGRQGCTGAQRLKRKPLLLIFFCIVSTGKKSP
ncbi:hypothetical protein D3C73_1291670 [compost metagenome]